MKLFVKKLPQLVIPTQGNPDDAAYDITAASEPIIIGTKFTIPMDGIFAWSKIDYIEYKTGLFITPENERNKIGQIIKYHIEVFPRSSICKKNLSLANSVALIDNGYRGEVCLRFEYHFQPEDLIVLPEAGRTRIYRIINPNNIYQKGDRIGQIKASINSNIEFEVVDSLSETIRGTGGFGSTN